MNLQTASTSVVSEKVPREGVFSLLGSHFIGRGSYSVDCEPISDGHFRTLMALVVVATFAFGCIVHGWLI
jgi:hypothetical protein